MEAAVIADRWHLDIVTVLDETDDLRWAVRMAGHLELNRMEKEQSDTAKRH